MLYMNMNMKSHAQRALQLVANCKSLEARGRERERERERKKKKEKGKEAKAKAAWRGGGYVAVDFDLNSNWHCQEPSRYR